MASEYSVVIFYCFLNGMQAGSSGQLIAIRLKIQTKSSHKTHKSQLLRLDFVNLKSWIAIGIV